MTNDQIPVPTSKELEAATTLPEFLQGAGELSVEERRVIAGQALLVLEQNYVHLPLKVARYAINPLQRLRLLLARLSREAVPEPEWRFHAEILEIFLSVRDLHTRYSLPEPFSRAVAFLPFRIKEFVEKGGRHYIVAPFRDGTPGPVTGTFRVGVEVTHWNGVPIERAVEIFGDRLPGANPAARHARALESFTVRSLGFAGPPDEEIVTIGYRDLTGAHQDLRTNWQVALPEPTAEADTGEHGTALGIDVEAARVAWLKTLLFAPHIRALQETGEPEVAVAGDIPVTREMATVFEARRVGEHAEYGYIRIRTFLAPASDLAGFINEFIRLLGLLPPSGVVIDIRGNPGGHVLAAELSLQALTPRRIQPQPTQFINTPLNLRICRDNPVLAVWLPSMEQAVETGAAYSSGFPLTPPELMSEVPQAYVGPVVLLIDARCYSAADTFAAGFQDHAIGKVLGVDASTGAGGANVWQFSDLLNTLSEGSPYQALPGGANLSVAIRRTLRVGPNTGASVEDFGVQPDEIHQITRDDILHQEVDLIAHATQLLDADAPEGGPRRFDVEVTVSADGLGVGFTVAQVDRADIYTDGRPRASVDLTAATASITVPSAVDPGEIRIEGFAGTRLVAVRVFRGNGPGARAATSMLAGL